MQFHLHELLSVGDPHLIAWLDLYEDAFPAYERGYVSWQIRALVDREAGRPTRSRLWALLDTQDNFTGMAQTSWHASQRLAYLGYFATLPEARGQGVGSIFYRLLLPEIQHNQPDFLLFDVEHPQHISDPALRAIAERRIGFYERKGARLLPGVTMCWNQSRQHMMFQRFTSVPDEEILHRAQALIASFGGELRPDSV